VAKTDPFGACHSVVAASDKSPLRWKDLISRENLRDVLYLEILLLVALQDAPQHALTATMIRRGLHDEEAQHVVEEHSAGDSRGEEEACAMDVAKDGEEDTCMEGGHLRRARLRGDGHHEVDSSDNHRAEDIDGAEHEEEHMEEEVEAEEPRGGKL